MRVCFVVQRYGLEINGGAELHCRWVAEHMAKYWEVEVLTTQAYDYVTWMNHYPETETVVAGIPVRRFPVSRPRSRRSTCSERMFPRWKWGGTTTTGY